MLRNKDRNPASKKDRGTAAKPVETRPADELSLDDLDKVVGGNAPARQERREDEPNEHQQTMAAAASPGAEQQTPPEGERRATAWWRAVNTEGDSESPRGEHRARGYQPPGVGSPSGEPPAGGPNGQYPGGYQPPNGQNPNGQTPSGEIPQGGYQPPRDETPRGETPSGETPSGEVPQGGYQPPRSETPSGEAPSGETPSGEVPQGGYQPPRDETPSGETPTGPIGTPPTNGDTPPNADTPPNDDGSPSGEYGDGPREGLPSGDNVAHPPQAPAGVDADVMQVVARMVAGGSHAAEQASQDILALLQGEQVSQDDLFHSILRAVDSHVLTGLQAADLLANLVADGDTEVCRVASLSIGELVTDHQITGEQAITMIVNAAVDALPANQRGAMGELRQIGYVAGMTTGQVVDTVSQMIVSHVLTGEQGADALVSMLAGTWGDYDYKPAIGAAMQELMLQQRIAPADVVGDMHDAVVAGHLPGNVAVATLLNQAAHVPGMQPMVRDEIGALLSSGHVTPNTVTACVQTAIYNHTLPVHHALEILDVLSASSSEGSQAAYDCLTRLTRNGAVTAETVIDSIHQAVVGDTMTAEAAIRVLAGLSGRDQSWGPQFGAEIAGLVTLGEITAADATAAIRAGAVSGTDATTMLVGMAVEGAATPDMQAAVNGALCVLVAQGVATGWSIAWGLLSTPLDSGTDFGPVLDGMFAAGLLEPQTIIGLWSSIATDGNYNAEVVSALPVIAGLVEDGKISATQVVDTIVSNVSWPYSAASALAKLSGASDELSDAAAAGITGLLTRGLSPNDAINAIRGASTAGVLSTGQAVELLIGISDAPGAATAVTARLSAMITNQDVGAATVVGLLHDAATSHELTAAQAVTVLGGLAMRGDAALLAAVTGELATLIASRQLTSDEASDVLRAVGASGTPAQQAVIGELMVTLGAAGEAAEMILDGIPANALPAQLDTAADQLALLVTQGRFTAEAIADEISDAVNAGRLTAEKAASVLAGLAGHGGAVAAAAGAELGDLMVAGKITMAQAASAIDSAIVAGSLTGAQAMSMLVTAAMDSDSRGFAMGALGKLGLMGNVVMMGLPGELSARIADHTLTGGQAIEMLAQLGSGFAGFANAQIAQGVADGKFAISDLHAAMTGHRLSAETAIGILAEVIVRGDAAIDAAAVAEITDIARAGTVSMTVLMDRLGSSLDLDQKLMIVAAVAVTGDAAAQTVAISAIVGPMNMGQMSAGQLSAGIAEAMSAHVLSRDQAVELLARVWTAGGIDMAATAGAVAGLVHLIDGDQAKLDAAIGVLAGAGQVGILTAVLATDVAAGGTDLLDRIGAAVTAHTLTADQAIAILTGHGPAIAPAIAGAELAELVNANVLPRDAVIGRLSSMTPADAAVGMLVVLAADATDAGTRNMAANGILSHVENNRVSAAATAEVMAQVAAGGDTDVQSTVGAQIARLVTVNKLSVDSAMAVVHSHGGAAQLALLSSMAAGGTYALQTVAFDDISAMVADGRVTAAQAIRAMGAAADLAAPEIQLRSGDAAVAAMRDAVAHEVGQLLVGDGTPAQQIANIHAAVVDHAISDAQAAFILADMAKNGPADATKAAIHELGVLVAAGEMTAAQAMAPINAAIADRTLQTWQALTLLSQLSVEPALLAAAGASFAGIIASGMPAGNAIAAISFAVNDGLITPEQSVAMMVAVGASGRPGLAAAVATELTVVLRGTLTIEQAMDAAARAAIDGHLPAANVIAVLGAFAESQGDIIPEAVVDAIATVAAHGHMSLADLSAAIWSATGTAPDITMFARTAAGSDAAVQAEFGLLAAMWVQQGVMSADQMIQRIHYSMLRNEMTGEQGLLLLANMSAAVAATPGGYTLHQAIHGEIASMIAYGEITDMQAVEVLRELSANGSPELKAAADAELTILMGDQQLLINVAGGGTPAEITGAATQLSAMINQGRASVASVMQDIADARQAGYLTGEQAIVFLAAVVGVGTGDGWAVNTASSGSQSWLLPVGATVAAIVGSGMPADAAMDVIGQAAAAHRLSSNQAVIMLAGIATQPGLQAAAAGEIAALIVRGDISARQAASDVTRVIGPDLLQADQAVQLIARIAGAPDATPAMAEEIGSVLATIPNYTMRPAEVLAAFTAVAQAEGIGATQAAVVLASIAAQGDGRDAAHVGAAIATLIADGVLAIGAVHGIIHDLPADKAAVVLAGMMAGSTVVQNTAIAEISNLVASGRITGAQVCSGIFAAVTTETVGEGLGGAQAVLAMAALPNVPEAGTTIASLVQHGRVVGDALQQLAAMAAAGGDQMQANAAQLIATVFGSDGGAIAASVSAGLEGIPADRQIEFLAKLSDTTGFTGQSVACQAIATILAQGDATAEQVVAGIRDAFAGTGRAGEAIELLVGVCASAPQVLRAAGIEIGRMIGDGEITAAAAAREIVDQDFFQRHVQGYGAEAVVTVLAAAMANAPTFAARDAFMVEALHYATHGTSPAAMTSAIGGAIEVGGLAAVDGLRVLMLFGTAPVSHGQYTPQVNAAAFDVLVGLIAADKATPEQLVIASASSGPDATRLQAACGHVLSGLTAGGHFTAEQVVNGVHNAIERNVLNAAQAVGVLATLGEGLPDLQRGATAEIARLISSGAMSGEGVAEVLIQVAKVGTARTVSAVGDQIALLAADGQITMVQAKTVLESAVLSQTMSAQNAVLLLANAAGSGDADMQVMAGGTLRLLLTQAVDALPWFRAAVNDGVLTVEQAVLTIAGASEFPGFPTTAVIGELVTAGKIGADAVMTLIHDAVVAGGLTAEQVLKMLPVIAEGSGNFAVRAAVPEAVCALVRDGLVSGERAVEILAGHAASGSPAFATLIGKEIGALVAAGLAGPADVNAAMAAFRQGLLTDVGFNVLFGVAAAGPTAQQLVAETLAAHVDGVNGSDYVIDLLRSAIASHRVPVETGVGVLVRCIATGGEQVDDAVNGAMVQMVQTAQKRDVWTSLMHIAGTTGAAEQAAVGEIIANITVPSSGTLIPGLDAVAVINSAVAVGTLTNEQAIVVLMHGAATERVLGGWQVASGTESSISGMVQRGLDVHEAIATIARIAADGDVETLHVAGQVIHRLTYLGQISVAGAMADIHGQATSGMLTPDQAIAVLVGLANPGLTATEVAVGKEINGMIAEGLISAERATMLIGDAVAQPGRLGATDSVAILAGLSSVAGPAMQATIGAEIAELVSQGRITAAAAMNGITAMVSTGTLTMEQALTLIPNVAVEGDATLRAAASAAIATVIAGIDDRSGLVTSTLLAAAGEGSAELQALIGAELVKAIGLGRLDLARTMDDIHAKAASTISPGEAAAVLGGMMAAGAQNVQGAAMAELLQLVSDGRISAADAVASIASGLSGDDAITGLVAIINHGPDGFDGAAVAELSAKLGRGEISVGQVMADVAQLTNGGKISQQQAVDVLSEIVSGSYPGLAVAAGHLFATLFPATWESGKLLLRDAVAQLGAGDGGANVVAMLATIGADKPAVLTACANAIVTLTADGHPTGAEAAESLVAAAARAGDPMMASIAALLSKIGAVDQVGSAVLEGTLPAADGLKLLLLIEGTPADLGRVGEQLGLLVSHGKLNADQVFFAINQDMAKSFEHLSDRNEWDMQWETFYQIAYREASKVIYNAVSILAGMAASDNEGTKDVAIAAMIEMGSRGNLPVPGLPMVLERAFTLEAVAYGVLQGVKPDEATEVLAELCIRVGPTTTMRTPGLQIVNAREELAGKVAGLVRGHLLDTENLVAIMADRWTHSDAAQQHVLADMLGTVIERSGCSTSEVAIEIREAISAGTLTLDQGITMMIAMSDQGVDRGAVGRVLADMLGQGGTTEAHIMATIANTVRDGGLDLEAAKTMLGGFVAGGADPAVVGPAIASISLEHWEVPIGSPKYDALMQALALSTAEFAAMANADRTPEAVIANLQRMADAEGIPVDLMLNIVLMQTHGVEGTDRSRTAIANVIRDNLTDGSFQNDLAELVASGQISAASAERMVESVAGGLWSVIPHPGVTAEQLVQAAVDLLHVEVQVATFAAQIIAGEKTAQEAIDAIVAAARTSRHTIDIGLAHLFERMVVPPIADDFLYPEMSGATAADVAAAQAAHDAAVVAVAEARTEVLQEIAGRMQLGDNAHDLAAAVTAGLLTPAAAVDLTLEIAMVGRDAENATLVQTIALARLGEAAQGPLHDLLATTPAYVERMLAGVSALILLDPPGMAVHTAFARTLFKDYINATADLTNPDDVDAKGDAAGQFFQGAWWFLRDKNAVANTFGHSIALIAEHPGSAESFEGFLEFGSTLASQGVPLQGVAGLPTIQGALLNAAFTGAATGAPIFASAATTVAGHASLEVPAWIATSMGQYAPNAWFEGTATINLSPALMFTIANVASKTLPLLLKIDAVADVLGETATGVLKGSCTLVSAACDMITNTVTGVVKEAAFSAYDAVVNFGEAYHNIQLLAADTVFGGFDSDALTANLEENSLQLARAVVPLMYGGVQLDSMIDAGVDTAMFTKDLLTGNFANLEDSARAMGISFLDIVLDNAVVQIGGEQLYKFMTICGATAGELLDWYMAWNTSESAEQDRRNIIGLVTGDTWERLGNRIQQDVDVMGSAFKYGFESIGDEIEDWFT